ncbi:MAG: DUF4358 domain-containing protein [Lachnospiraceae bacterium]|nr:DUF4358 domain-containing protein [Lachnospiraceae bacterium]
MKKLVVLMLAMVMSVSVIACGGKNTNDNNDANAGTESGATDNNAGNGTTGDNAADDESVFGDVPMADLKTAVTDVLGENYWPAMALDAQMLSDMCGITEDMYDDFLAEMPMMSAHIDTMIIIKAKDGQVEAVEEAMNTYRDGLVENSLYPSHVAKSQASRIEVFDNYVCFVLLGGDTSSVEEQGEEAIITYCHEQNEKAIDAIRTTLTE